VQRWLRSNERGEPDLALLAPDVKNHNIPPGRPRGREDAREVLEPYFKAFSDRKMTIYDIFAEGDKVAIRCTTSVKHIGEFQGIQGDGKQINISFMQIWKIKEGMLDGVWERYDALGMMQQLGIHG
jgi:predicted ester cyclase